MINSSVFELLSKREIVLESALSLYARLVEMDTLLRSVPGLPLRRYAEQNGISLRTAQRHLATLAAIVGDIRPLRIPGADDQHAVHWYVGLAPHLVEIASGLVSRKEPSPLASADVQASQQNAADEDDFGAGLLEEDDYSPGPLENGCVNECQDSG